MASRNQRKMWRNGPGGKWNCRIRWYDTAPTNRAATDGDNIRLVLEDSEMEINLYPTTKANADNIWFMFRHGCPDCGGHAAVVKDLLALIKGRNLVTGEHA